MESNPNTVVAEMTEPKPQPTLAEIKKFMKINWTIEHPTVQACGHKLDTTTDPKNRNCRDCWFAYFQNNGEMTATAVEVLEKEGYAVLVGFRGEKFAKFFIKFMAYVEALQKELNANAGKPVQD